MSRMPCLEWEHIFGPTFLVNLTALNKQPFKVKVKFKSREHASSPWTINKFTGFLVVSYFVLF